MKLRKIIACIICLVLLTSCSSHSNDDLRINREEAMTEDEVRALIDKVYKELPKRPLLTFSIERGNPGLYDCKLGGIPYFPKDMEYPKGTEGEYKDTPLRLLAQINFEQIPHIPDFPETGILQFFCA